MTRTWIFGAVLFFSTCFRGRLPIDSELGFLALGLICGSAISLLIHWVVCNPRSTP